VSDNYRKNKRCCCGRNVPQRPSYPQNTKMVMALDPWESVQQQQHPPNGQYISDSAQYSSQTQAAQSAAQQQHLPG
jgi:hypothetical protein